MRYIHVIWFHENPEDPVELYSELDGDGWEVRKVEIFREGKVGFAGQSESLGLTRLGLEPVPPLEELALDAQFRPEMITKAEFDRMWVLAHSPAKSPQELNYSRTNPREG